MDAQQSKMLMDTHDAAIRSDEKLTALIDTQKDHSKRIRSLERWNWKILGGVSVIGLISAFKKQLTNIFM